MAKAAATHGVEIRLSTPVRKVLVENGRAIGVETEWAAIRAVAVAAGINPKLLYLNVVNSRDLPEDFRRRMENWRCPSGTFRMNVALSELPDFTVLPGRRPAEHPCAGHYHRPKPRLYGAGLFRCAIDWLVAPPHH